MVYLSYDVDILAFLGLATVLASLKKNGCPDPGYHSYHPLWANCKKNVNVNHQIYTEYSDK